MQALSTAKSNGDSGPNPGYPCPHLGLCGAHKVFTHMGYGLGIWGGVEKREKYQFIRMGNVKIGVRAWGCVKVSTDMDKCVGIGTITGRDFLPGYKRVARKRAFIWVGG